MSVESMYDWIEREDAINEIEKLKNKLGTQWLQDICMRNGLIYAQRCVKSLPNVNRWIPVDDALPEIGYSVLVTRQTENNTRYVRIASRQDDCWMDNTDKYGKPNPHPVIAWMPMPDAYEPPNNMIGD